MTVTVTEAAKQTVVLKLKSTALPAAGPAAVGAANTNVSLGDPLAGDHAQHGSGLRIASYVSFGVGAVGLGVGTYFLLKAKSSDDEAGKLFDQCVAIDRSGKCGSIRDQYERVGVFTARTGRVKPQDGRQFLDALELSLSTSSFWRLEDA